MVIGDIVIYVGSKARFAKELVPIIQGYINESGATLYIEPFVGGANIIDKVKCQSRIGADINNGLIAVYQAVQYGWRPPLHITEQDYAAAKCGDIAEPLRTYIGFNASYASKYFGGFARSFKSDGVTPRDHYNERTRNFMKQIPKLAKITFLWESYERMHPYGAVIYCDPPYADTLGYSNTPWDADAFWAWVRQESKNNIVLISEYKAPEDFTCLWRRSQKTLLDKQKSGKTTVEKLFIHTPSSSRQD